MALIHCDFFSKTLGLSTAMTVILPPREAPAPEPPAPETPPFSREAQRSAPPEGDALANPRLPTLYLLHGLSDDHTAWIRRTSIERYVASLRLAVVMPRVDRSWYTDMAQGLRYWSFISEELPAVARSFFPLSAKREDNFVAGLSMGGYGAFKLALRKPEQYAAAASLSGALDLSPMIDSDQNEDKHRANEMSWAFGDLDRFPGSEHDTMALASKLAASSGPKPRLYQCCGTADFLYQQNLAFRDHARTLGLDLTYEEDDDFSHSWDYWDLTIQRVLKWMVAEARE